MADEMRSHDEIKRVHDLHGAIARDEDLREDAWMSCPCTVEDVLCWVLNDGGDEVFRDYLNAMEESLRERGISPDELADLNPPHTCERES